MGSFICQERDDIKEEPAHDKANNFLWNAQSDPSLLRTHN